MKTETNAPGWVFFIEALEGIQEVKTYATREEAMEAFKQEIKFIWTGDCKNSYKSCEAAAMDDNKTVYVVQKIEDAVQLNDKMVWSTNQSIFFDTNGIPPATFEWRHQFATKEEAVKLYKERLELYQIQADKDPEIEIIPTKSGLGTLICKNGKPVVDLFCESKLIGQVSNVGTVILNGI